MSVRCLRFGADRGRSPPRRLNTSDLARLIAKKFVYLSSTIGKITNVFVDLSRVHIVHRNCTLSAAHRRHTALRQLSGGNQQKVVLAKWLSTRANLYLLDEPTVGVDIRAKAEIYRVIDELAAQGAAVLLFSTDLIELQGITDRILILARGKLVRELVSKETSHQEILGWASAAGSGSGSGSSPSASASASSTHGHEAVQA